MVEKKIQLLKIHIWRLSDFIFVSSIQIISSGSWQASYTWHTSHSLSSQAVDTYHTLKLSLSLHSTIIFHSLKIFFKGKNFILDKNCQKNPYRAWLLESPAAFKILRHPGLFLLFAGSRAQSFAQSRLIGWSNFFTRLALALQLDYKSISASPKWWLIPCKAENTWPMFWQ